MVDEIVLVGFTGSSRRTPLSGDMSRSLYEPPVSDANDTEIALGTTASTKAQKAMVIREEDSVITIASVVHGPEDHIRA